MASSTTWARSYMSFRASPAVHVSRLRVVSVTSAEMSISRMTNATRSSIRVMPATGFLTVFMVQRLGGPVVFDFDLLDLRAALPRLGAAHLRRVEGSHLVFDV